ncbi:hypothetical protein [Gordonia sihwensis]|uniref:hypothetical protein n=1 Tax=Gordonia sihwensis TaxID=173559 RepID=UPI0005EF9890|nr:hypothetical protein [Gordonia sihwensis]KJR10530.1 hypothetical protein UG54_00605 [Gordonia sihwensis]
MTNHTAGEPNSQDKKVLRTLWSLGAVSIIAFLIATGALVVAIISMNNDAHPQVTADEALPTTASRATTLTECIDTVRERITSNDLHPTPVGPFAVTVDARDLEDSRRRDVLDEIERVSQKGPEHVQISTIGGRYMPGTAPAFFTASCGV